MLCNYLCFEKTVILRSLVEGILKNYKKQIGKNISIADRRRIVFEYRRNCLKVFKFKENKAFLIQVKL